MLQNSATKNKNTDGHSFRHFFSREHFFGGRGFPRGPNHCPQSGKKREKGRNRQFGGFGHFTIKMGRNPGETVVKPSKWSEMSYFCLREACRAPWEFFGCSQVLKHTLRTPWVAFLCLRDVFAVVHLIIWWPKSSMMLLRPLSVTDNGRRHRHCC